MFEESKSQNSPVSDDKEKNHSGLKITAKDYEEKKFEPYKRSLASNLTINVSGLALIGGGLSLFACTGGITIVPAIIMITAGGMTLILNNARPVGMLLKLYSLIQNKCIKDSLFL